MSNPIYKKTIECPEEELGGICENPKKEHYISVQYFANSVEVIESSCAEIQRIHLTDFVWNKFIDIINHEIKN